MQVSTCNLIFETSYLEEIQISLSITKKCLNTNVSSDTITKLMLENQIDLKQTNYAKAVIVRRRGSAKGKDASTDENNFQTGPVATSVNTAYQPMTLPLPFDPAELYSKLRPTAFRQ